MGDAKKQKPDDALPVSGWKEDREPTVLEQFSERLFEDERVRFENGDKNALAETLWFCLFMDLPVPRWARIAFSKGVFAIRNFEHESWDDVLGKPHVKRKTGALRKRRQRAKKLKDAVQQLRQEGRPLDRFLFEDIGKRLGVAGSTLEREYYRDIRKYLDPVEMEEHSLAMAAEMKDVLGPTPPDAMATMDWMMRPEWRERFSAVATEIKARRNPQQRGKIKRNTL